MFSFEYLVVFGGLIFRLGAFSAYGESYPIYYFSKLVIYALSLILSLSFFSLRLNVFLETIRKNSFFFLLTAYIGLTLTWNENVRWGALDFVRNLDVLFFSLFIVFRYEEYEVLNLIKKALNFIVFISIVLFFIDRNTTIWGGSEIERAIIRFHFRGILPTKGSMAAVVNVLLLLNFSLPRPKVSRYFGSIVYVLLLVLVLFLASSITSIFGFVFLFLILNLLRVSKKNKLLFFIRTVGVFVSILTLTLLNNKYAYLDQIFMRDFTTFSGRITGWLPALDLIKNNLILGYGSYGYCFTEIVTGEKCDWTNDLGGFGFGGQNVTLPHNFFISFLLDYGCIGTFLLLVVNFVFYSRLIALNKNERINPSTVFFKYFSIFIIVIQLFGDFAFKPLNNYWILFVLVYFLTYRQNLEVFSVDVT